MAFIRRIFWFMRRKPAAKRGYTEEVLYAGWVDTLPPKINKRRK